MLRICALVLGNVFLTYIHDKLDNLQQVFEYNIIDDVPSNLNAQLLHGGKTKQGFKKENINRSNTRSDLSECSYIRNKALFD